MGCFGSKVLPWDAADMMMMFVKNGGNSQTFPMIEQYFSHRKARIAKSEERSLTLKELTDLRHAIESGCANDHWTDPFTGRKLKPADVNLYNLNYEHIMPATVPEGVVVKGLNKGSYKAGDVIEQREDGKTGLPMAKGYVRKNTKGPNVLVTVTQGRFVQKSTTSKYAVTVDGQAAGEPSDVSCENSVSYKELVNPVPLKPTWFTSHWWGEPVMHFIACCENHAKLRKLPEEAGYWVCAYANRQHDLAGDISEDPDETSFRRAMRLAQGVLLILDSQAKPFTRIWCCFELHRTIVADDKLVDIATFHDEAPVLLADGSLSDEEPYMKRRREMAFPISLLAEGLRCRLEYGEATMTIDRLRILNCIRGNKKALEDETVLAVIEAGKIKDMHVYEKANDCLHARFAVAAWPQAVKRGLVDDFDKKRAKTLNLPKILAKDKSCDEVHMDFRNFDEFDDKALKVLANALPEALQGLELYCGGCPLTDTGFTKLVRQLPGTLRKIKISAPNCENITDESSGAYAKKFTTKLTHLELIFSRCTKMTDNTLTSIAKNLPASLEELSLDFGSCTKVTGPGLLELGSLMPRKLKSLHLDFAGCNSITKEEVRSFVKLIPLNLKDINLNLRGTGAGREFGAYAELKSWASG